MKQELEELKKQKEKIKNKYNNEIKELIIKYEEIKESTLKEIQKYNNIDKEKEKLENLITMNEIIKNCQKKFEDNYYINNDFIKIINSFKNSENIKIKNLFNSEKFIPSITPILNENNINININDNYDKEKFNNDNNYNYKTEQYLSRKLKRGKDSYEPGEIPSDDEENFFNNINLNKNKENENNINNNFDIINIESAQNSSIDEDDTKSLKSNDFIFEENELDENRNNKECNLINDAYCAVKYGNSFIVFNSINEKSYIIYSNKKRTIITYNLPNKYIERKIPTAHSTYISHFNYCFNANLKKELIMSVSFKDSNLKIWYFLNWQCLFNIKNLYKGFLYSACFLNKPNNYYIAISSYSEIKEPIRIYDYGKKLFKTLLNSEQKTTSLLTYYNKKDVFIIANCEEQIIAYDYYKNKIFGNYNDNNCKIILFQIYKNYGDENIFSLCEDNYIRIWKFYSAELLKKIELNNINVRTFCL